MERVVGKHHNMLLLIRNEPISAHSFPHKWRGFVQCADMYDMAITFSRVSCPLPPKPGIGVAITFSRVSCPLPPKPGFGV